MPHKGHKLHTVASNYIKKMGEKREHGEVTQCLNILEYVAVCAAKWFNEDSKIRSVCVCLCVRV